MATRTSNKLSDTALRKTQFKPGIYGDGNGLYLRVSGTGAKSFVMIYIRNKVRREIGLGGYPDTSLAVAREKARVARDLLSKGGDPLTEKRRAAPPTLDALTDEYVEEFAATVVPDVSKRWRSLITIHAPKLCPMPVDKITTDDVVSTLKAVQKSNPATAKHLRSILERIFASAKFRGFRTDNPAIWKGHLSVAIAQLGNKKHVHQPSLPYADCPAFFAKLGQDMNNAKAAIRFLMLTAARSNDVTGMQWSEIAGDVWTIPAERTKNRKEFKVPLAPAALAVIERLRSAIGEPKPEGFVFAGRFESRPMAGFTLLRTLHDECAVECTVHGFRSSFSTYFAEQTEVSSELVEACLQHSVGNAVRQAYMRGDLLERRRKVMETWSDFLTK